MVAVEDVLKGVLEWAFSQRLEDEVETAVGLGWKDLSLVRGLREALVDSFKTDRDRLWVKVADMEGLLLH